MGSKAIPQNFDKQDVYDSPSLVKPIFPRYEYTALGSPKSIRLINLLPCDASQLDQRLKCELQIVSLSENPSFAALSYTWGNEVFPETLTCEKRVIHITKNLHDALVQFRLQDRALTIWVDAVCINQADDGEKSLQVPLMAEIYGQATEVLIWLGEESEGSTDVMLYLKRIGQRFVDRGGEIEEPRDEHGPENDAIWADVIGDPNLERTGLIWGRPWFSRRWIIQELALARKPIVHYGRASMDWHIMQHAAMALARLRGDGSQFWNSSTGRLLHMDGKTILNVQKLDNIRKEIWKNTPNTADREMFECLDQARAFECRDAKDRVFALLGIFNRGRNTPFEVAYGKSEAEVYEAFARYCLKYGNTVDILSWAGECNHASIGGRLNIPSWVPDWRLPFRSPTDILHGFRAGHRLKSMVELEGSSQELLARGMLVDRVQAVVLNIQSFADPSEVRRWSFLEPLHVPQWYLHVEHMLSRTMGVDYGTRKEYVAGGDVWEALARTLIIDRTDLVFDYKRDRPNEPSVMSAPLHTEFSGFRSLMLSKLEAPDKEEAQPAEPPVTVMSYEHMEYHIRAVSISEDRCFYITRKGYIGLGPKGMQTHDMICILAGSSVPYVIRPQSGDFCMIGEGDVPIQQKAYIQMPNGDLKPYILRTREEKHRLIGECYAHGLMDGQVWGLDHVFFEDFRII